MAEEPVTDATARALRRAWFDYLDAVEPLRRPLHAYCLRLTGEVWDAEDLTQEALLKGFAMIGRGDLHGPGSPVANPKAYLFRTATNLWLDQKRRQARERRALDEPAEAAPAANPDALREAGEALFAAASPQARAAVVLKDAFGFSLEEIADQLRTTPGAVKAALHRGREALKSAPPVPPAPRPGPDPAAVDRFVEAFHSRDVAQITAALTESCSVEVPGVGGGRGRRGGWAEASAGHTGVRLERCDLHGEAIVAMMTEADGRLTDVLRLETADGLVSRLIDYYFCPDTLAAVAEALGLEAEPRAYHQPPQMLVQMITTTTLPWGGDGLELH